MGGLSVGWGVFNVAQGIVGHHVLQTPRVRAGVTQPWWNFGFLVWGATMPVCGLLLARSGNRDSRRQAAPLEH